MIEFAALAPTLRDAAAHLPPQTVPTTQALGRVLAHDATAAWPLPRFAAAALDGYAVRITDTAAATATAPVRLRLAGTAYAGAGQPPPLAPGTAVRIATGGVAPQGADGLVPREYADDDGTTVCVRAPAGAHIRRVGEELAAGALVVAAGTRLRPLHVAALTAAGVARVTVARAPRVAVVATGAELIAAGDTPRPGQVVDTNGALIATWLARRLWIDTPQPLRIDDDRNATEAALARALTEADVVITSGGVSVGDHDVVRPAAAALGFQTVVPKVALKPGKPLYVARREAQWLVGLPGNPAAVAAGLLLAAGPLAACLEGDAAWWPATLRLPATMPLKQDPNRTQLVWAQASGAEARPLPRRQSHMLTDLAAANVALVVPPGEGDVAAGTLLDALRL